MAAPMENVRVKISFEDLLNSSCNVPPKAWFLVKTSKVQTIGCLGKEIVERFSLPEQWHFDLYVENCLLPEWEDISVLRENDLISVQAIYPDGSGEGGHKKKKSKKKKDQDKEKERTASEVEKAKKKALKQLELISQASPKKRKLETSEVNEAPVKRPHTLKSPKKGSPIVTKKEVKKDTSSSDDSSSSSDSDAEQKKKETANVKDKTDTKVEVKEDEAEQNGTVEDNMDLSFNSEKKKRKRKRKRNRGKNQNDTSLNQSYNNYQANTSWSQQSNYKQNTPRQNAPWKNKGRNYSNGNTGNHVVFDGSDGEGSPACAVVVQNAEVKDPDVKTVYCQDSGNPSYPKNTVPPQDDGNISYSNNTVPPQDYAPEPDTVEHMDYSYNSIPPPDDIGLDWKDQILNMAVENLQNVPRKSKRGKGNPSAEQVASAPVFTRANRMKHKKHANFSFSKAEQLSTVATNKSYIFKNEEGQPVDTPIAVEEATEDTSKKSSNGEKDADKSEKEKLKENVQDFSDLPTLHSPPAAGSLIAFKIIEMGENYCPSVSPYKVAKVLSSEASNLTLSMILDQSSKTAPGRFDIVYDEMEKGESSQTVVHPWSSLIDPKLVPQ